MPTNDAMTRWLPKLREFAGPFMQSVPALRAIAADASLVLHGSTTFGIDDTVSDLDLWVLVDGSELSRVDAASPTRFFEFQLDGKAGHFTVHAREEFAERVSRCDLPLIAELRTSAMLTDSGDCTAAALMRRARLPMPAEVRDAWFAYHYIEMRSEHRSCDNPIERCNATAVLLAAASTIAHALRTAMVLDGEPYPYVKWLATAASRTPTGAAIAPLVDEAIDMIGQGVLKIAGPEREHPLSLKLREIRRALISAARARGRDAPWLDHWYLHLDMRQRIGDARWHAE